MGSVLRAVLSSPRISNPGVPEAGSWRVLANVQLAGLATCHTWRQEAPIDGQMDSWTDSNTLKF